MIEPVPAKESTAVFGKSTGSGFMPMLPDFTFTFLRRIRSRNLFFFMEMSKE